MLTLNASQATHCDRLHCAPCLGRTWADIVYAAAPPTGEQEDPFR